MAELLVGCCGWPEACARYYEHFPIVELQDTFYQPPSVALAEKWRRDAPPEFRFALKAWQLITHPPSSPTYRRLKTPVPETKRDACGFFRPGGEVQAAWEQTLAVARALRVVAIVFQCPASFKPEPANIANLEAFFRRIERGRWLLAWEPRGQWPPAEVRRICEACDLVHCVDPFQAEPVWGRARYFRLHGRGGHRYRYTDEELRQLRDRLTGPGAAYVMFNNVYMLEDALRFRDLITDSARRPASRN